MRRYKVDVKGKEYIIHVQELSANRFRVMLHDQALEVELLADEDLAEARITPAVLPAQVEQVIERPAASYRPAPPDMLERPPDVPTPALPPRPELPGEGRVKAVTAPMPGVIHSVEVSPGAIVTRGQTLLILEAMKMKNHIKSPQDGTVEEVPVHAGQCIGYGDVLVRFGEVKP